MSERDKVMT